MSNYDKLGFLYDDDRAVMIGPETVNGTGQVYLDADPVCVLTNAQARELAAALVEAADYAEAVRAEVDGCPLGRPSNSVRAFVWSNPAWRVCTKFSTPTGDEPGT